MTQLLEDAIAKVRELPESEQAVIASLIMEELEDEQRWFWGPVKSRIGRYQNPGAALYFYVHECGTVVCNNESVLT